MESVVTWPEKLQAVLAAADALERDDVKIREHITATVPGIVEGGHVSALLAGNYHRPALATLRAALERFDFAELGELAALVYHGWDPGRPLEEHRRAVAPAWQTRERRIEAVLQRTGLVIYLRRGMRTAGIDIDTKETPS